MSLSPAPRLRDLGGDVKASWQRFLETYEPLRPDLYRYCRHLTRSAWDAEDMAQEALTRAFVALACLTEPPQNPRAWLFRVATNQWSNQTRRARERPSGGDAPEPSVQPEPRASREAAGTLLASLAPQERAALVLKDAFGLSLEEIAEALATTPGAIKSALHRGRAKLVQPEPADPTTLAAPVSPRVLDAFCEAFNARDLDRLTGLLLETATMEFPGLRVEAGVNAIREGSLRSTLFGCAEGGYPPSMIPRCEVRLHREESILLWWWAGEVHAVVRIEVQGDRVARMVDYHHAPDVLDEVCRELEVPFRTHGYAP